MEGYRLTTKGFVVLTLLFFAFFISMTYLLTIADQPDIGQPVDATPEQQTDTPSPPGTSAPISPQTPPADQTPPPPPSSGNVPPTENAPPSEDVAPTGGEPPAATPPPIDIQPPVRVSPNGAPSHEDYLELLFPLYDGALSEQGKADLQAFIEAIPSAEKEDLVLSVEGRAYANEAPDAEAVNLLAQARMEAVLDGFPPADSEVGVQAGPTSYPPTTDDVIVGAVVYLIHSADK